MRNYRNRNYAGPVASDFSEYSQYCRSSDPFPFQKLDNFYSWNSLSPMRWKALAGCRDTLRRGDLRARYWRIGMARPSRACRILRLRNFIFITKAKITFSSMIKVVVIVNTSKSCFRIANSRYRSNPRSQKFLLEEVHVPAEVVRQGNNWSRMACCWPAALIESSRVTSSLWTDDLWFSNWWKTPEKRCLGVILGRNLLEASIFWKHVSESRWGGLVLFKKYHSRWWFHAVRLRREPLAFREIVSVCHSWSRTTFFLV